MPTPFTDAGLRLTAFPPAGQRSRFDFAHHPSNHPEQSRRARFDSLTMVSKLKIAKQFLARRTMVLLRPEPNFASQRWYINLVRGYAGTYHNPPKPRL
jgi:hypothetical protein